MLDAGLAHAFEVVGRTRQWLGRLGLFVLGRHYHPADLRDVDGNGWGRRRLRWRSEPPMTAPALIKEADMMRAIRAAKKLGAVRVSIAKDGTIVFDMSGQESQLPKGQPESLAQSKSSNVPNGKSSKMPRPHLPHLQLEWGRKRADGTRARVYYFRKDRASPRMRIDHPWGSPGFIAAYNTFMAGHFAPVAGVKRRAWARPSKGCSISTAKAKPGTRSA